MSTSSHDCSEAIDRLYAYLDGELDEPRVAEVRAHLEHCAPCLEAFDFEAELRKVVVSRCAEKVPQEVRLRILAVLERLSEEGPDSVAPPSL